MKNNTLPVSVCLISFQRRNTVIENINAILQLDPAPQEIIVVDNGSTDGTSEALQKKFTDKQITLITLQKNTGIAAYNIAFEKSSSPYIMILDDDSHPAENSLQKAVEIIEKDPALAAIAFRIVDNITKQTAKYWFLPEGDLPYEALAFVGCGALVRRNHLLKVGGYSPEFFLYENELDVGLQFRLNGWKIEYHPECIAYHPSSQRRGTSNMVYFGTKNKLIIVWKYLPFTHSLPLTLEFIITNLYLSIKHGRIILRWKAFFTAIRDYVRIRRRYCKGDSNKEAYKNFLELLKPLTDELKLSTWIKRDFGK